MSVDIDVNYSDEQVMPNLGLVMLFNLVLLNKMRIWMTLEMGMFLWKMWN